MASRTSPRIQFVVLGLKAQVLALASKPASAPKCTILGSRTAQFFDSLKMGQGQYHFYSSCWSIPETLPKFMKTFFFGDHFKILFCVLALRISVLGLESVCQREVGLWPRIFLCPWPQPQPLALCARLNLWYSHSINLCFCFSEEV